MVLKYVFTWRSALKDLSLVEFVVGITRINLINCRSALSPGNIPFRCDTIFKRVTSLLLR